MKPEKLILCGWGPYKEKQEIDFKRLSGRGLFLITGPTGAGKTTIFDAITYALYGNMSGQVREKNSVRSDFAGEDVPTYVELSMTHGGKEYFIYRNPEYLRPKKRKTGTAEMTKEKERAYLVLPDGNKIEGTSEVNGKIQEILRLDYKQFKQLSLIAQGEFARLLTASSAEKSRIFREIFDTELYDKMAGLLRGRSSGIYRQVMEYRHKMEEDLSFFNPFEEEQAEWQRLTGKEGFYYDEIIVWLQQLLKKQRLLLKEQETINRKHQQETEKLTIQITEAEKIKSLFERCVLEEQKQKELSEKFVLVAEWEKKLQKARQALSVSTCEQAWLHAVHTREELSGKNALLEREVCELSKKQEAEEDFHLKWNLIELAYEKGKQEAGLGKKQEELAEAYEEQQKILVAMQKEYLEAEQKELTAKEIYETAERRYRHAVAGVLADALQENQPCPVCGSLHHPQKAVIPEDMSTAREVEDKKQIYEAKRQNTLTLHGKTAACKERTDGFWENLLRTQNELAAYAEEKQNRDSYVREYVEHHSEAQFIGQKKEFEARQIRLKEREALLNENREEERQKAVQVQEKKMTFLQKQSENGFDTEEAYRQAFLPEEEMRHLEQEVASYREERHANEQLLLHLKEELAGKEPADIEALQMQLEEAKTRGEESLKQLAAKNHYVQDIERLLASLLGKMEKKQKLEEEYGIVKRLDDAVSGNNRLRLVFEQYVLAACFEEILKAANIRLRTMSFGRYELRRMEAVGDGRKKDNLEMEVMDYYTGKYRSVKTLSGGESFKTSLALALGMSDVVQALSGGVRVEALFIDEGFGSLDSESLEQASLTLQSLVERDRLIGIISHVPELAEKITDKIRIYKTNAGSRAEIMLS